jgi:hypothetical protein
MHDLKVGRASLREEMYNLERASGFPQAAAYQSSSRWLFRCCWLPAHQRRVRVSPGFCKDKQNQGVGCQKDAQIDLLGKQIKSLSNEIRLLREEMPRYASFGIPSGNRPAQNDNTIYQEDKNGRQDNVESAPWMGSFRAAYASGFILIPKPQPGKKCLRCFLYARTSFSKAQAASLIWMRLTRSLLRAG